MEKVYIVYILRNRDIVSNVSFYNGLDCETHYSDIVLEPIKEFLDKQSAEVWIRMNGKNYGEEMTLLEVYR